jgi:hypothetical protein
LNCALICIKTASNTTQRESARPIRVARFNSSFPEEIADMPPLSSVLLVAVTSLTLSAASVQKHPRTLEYTFRVFDETAQAWLPGVLVELTVLDGSSPPQSDISDNKGGVSFRMASPAGTLVQLDLSKAGYCPLSVTLALPEKRGKGLAPQIAMTQCAPARAATHVCLVNDLH